MAHKGHENDREIHNLTYDNDLINDDICGNIRVRDIYGFTFKTWVSPFNCRSSRFFHNSEFT